MSIENCPHCGGTHFGSNECPFSLKGAIEDANRREACGEQVVDKAGMVQVAPVSVKEIAQAVAQQLDPGDRDSSNQRAFVIRKITTGISAAIAPLQAKLTDAVNESNQLRRELDQLKQQPTNEGIAKLQAELEQAAQENQEWAQLGKQQIIKNEQMEAELEQAKGIRTNKRQLDLVRYMRAELHRADLITDEEFTWLLTAADEGKIGQGSISARRLEDYDQLQTRLATAEAECDQWKERAEKAETSGKAWELTCKGKEGAYVKMEKQRDALLEMTWLDLPGEPIETIEEWKTQFNKDWVRRAEVNSPRWIPLAERKPTEADCYKHPTTDHPLILVVRDDGRFCEVRDLKNLPTNAAYFLPLPKLPPVAAPEMQDEAAAFKAMADGRCQCVMCTGQRQHAWQAALAHARKEKAK